MDDNHALARDGFPSSSRPRLGGRPTILVYEGLVGTVTTLDFGFEVLCARAFVLEISFGRA